MNKYLVEYTGNGFTQTLVFEGKTFVKRYKRTAYGYQGLDLPWEDEEELPDLLVEALEDNDAMEIMNCLNG